MHTYASIQAPSGTRSMGLSRSRTLSCSATAALSPHEHWIFAGAWRPSATCQRASWTRLRPLHASGIGSALLTYGRNVVAPVWPVMLALSQHSLNAFLLLQVNLALTCKAFLRRYLLTGRVRARLDDQTAGTDARLHNLNTILALHANSIEDLELYCIAFPHWIMGLQDAMTDALSVLIAEQHRFPTDYPGPPVQLRYG